jgi:hypothetical protein
MPELIERVEPNVLHLAQLADGEAVSLTIRIVTSTAEAGCTRRIYARSILSLRRRAGATENPILHAITSCSEHLIVF